MDCPWINCYPNHEIIRLSKFLNVKSKENGGFRQVMGVPRLSSKSWMTMTYIVFLKQPW
jgi:hypothetical protein